MTRPSQARDGRIAPAFSARTRAGQPRRTPWSEPNGIASAGFSQMLFGRRNVEGGERTNDLEHTSFRAVVGLKGEIIEGWLRRRLPTMGVPSRSNSGG